MVGSVQTRLFLLVGGVLIAPGILGAGEDPPINPFGPRANTRADALPGYVELSDGTVHPGQLYLTRDARLKIFDEEKQQHREVPLRVIRRIDCAVQKEWIEKEWRFKENANDEKYYTGRSYPAREHAHAVTLADGRKMRGELSGIIYLQPEAGGEAERYLLHKRDKGPVGSTLKSLLYVRSVVLGAEALEEGKRKTAGKTSDKK